MEEVKDLQATLRPAWAGPVCPASQAPGIRACCKISPRFFTDSQEFQLFLPLIVPFVPAPSRTSVSSSVRQQ